MSEAAAAIAGAGGEGGDGGDAAAAAAAAAGGGADAGAADRWQDKFLPAELAGNEHLANYKTLEDFAKGAINTAQWARGRVAIPAADDATAFAEFVGKVRPADPAAYTIGDAEGKPTDISEAFRPIFHEAGLHPMQAKLLNDKWNQYQADAVSKIAQTGKTELTAMELDLGPAAYTQRLTAVDNMLKGMGIEVDDIAPALEQVVGSGKAMAALFAMAEKTGELAKVDGDTVAMRMGAMSPQAAQEALEAMTRNTDAEFQKKLGDPNSPEYAKRKALLETIAKARSGGQR